MIELSRVKFHEKENPFDRGGICLACGDNSCGLFHKQTVSYKKSMLTDNISSFETAAKTAMALYEDGNEDGVWLFTVDTDANNLACYNGYEHLLYPLTEEQKKAFVTVKSVFRLDHLGFECLYVNENFATFGIANGRASFIYSKSNQKPDFVNLAEITDKNRVYVEKITDNWFYACK